MVVRVHIHGEGEASRLGSRLIEAGDGDLKDKLYAAIRRANLGVDRELRASAIRRLPSGGGLGAEVATARITMRRSMRTATGVGINITAHHEYDLKGLDQGLNVHPLFGRRTHWYPQAVRPGWWSSVIREQIPATRHALERAVKQYLTNL